jgi:hypothetical protein
MSAPPEIIIQIIVWSLGMVLFSMWLSKKFGMNATQQIEMQSKMQEFQDQMQLAQSDPQRLQQLQLEMMGFMKVVMKKQMLPMLVRMGIFFIFIAVLGGLYGSYGDIFPIPILIFGQGWFALYFIVAISFSLLMGLIKMIIKKINPPKEDKNAQFQDSLRALQNNMMFGQASPMGRPGMFPGAIPMGLPQSRQLPMLSQPTQMPPGESSLDRPVSTNKSWKSKLSLDNSEEDTKDQKEEQ